MKSAKWEILSSCGEGPVMAAEEEEEKKWCLAENDNGVGMSGMAGGQNQATRDQTISGEDPGRQQRATEDPESHLYSQREEEEEKEEEEEEEQEEEEKEKERHELTSSFLVFSIESRFCCFPVFARRHYRHHYHYHLWERGR